MSAFHHQNHNELLKFQIPAKPAMAIANVTSVGSLSLLRAHSLEIESRTALAFPRSALAPPVFPFHVLALAHPPPMARAIGSSMDHDCRFDSPRSPVFVEGGGASPAGWPLHRMTLTLHTPGVLQHNAQAWARYSSAVKASNDGNTHKRPGAETFTPCRQYSCMRWLICALTILFLSLSLS